MKTSKKIATAFFAPIILALAIVLAAFVSLKALTGARNSKENAVSLRLKIEQGDSTRKIAALLEQNKIIKNKHAFYLLARFPRLGPLVSKQAEEVFCVKAGVCDLDSSMDAGQIYAALSAGHEELVSVSIPEGLTVSKIAARLQSADICSAESFNAAAKGLEGFLFPDTYMLAPQSDAKKVVQIMTENFYKKISQIPSLNSLRTDKDRLNQIVTLASIIEREYRSVDEAPLIASVFTNRIKKGIGLYSCATVEYVITEVLGRPHPDIITYDDLKIQSPYNTYLNAGLPPAPICNPGLVALKAAAEPAQTDFYYFQLMDEAAGRHVFTKTLSEHVAQGVIFKTKKASR
ncbi:MAG: endolytic transglycosylase MltG [Treponema sp.]|nr:endolytic transglycosylase MltG [Treponema sp.]